MRKTRRALALFTAAALSASAFSGLAISASAGEELEKSFAPAEATVIHANGNKDDDDKTLADQNYYDADATSWRITQDKVSKGVLSNLNAAYGGSYDLLVKFDASEIASGKIDTATLSFDAVCTTATKNSNIDVASIGTNWKAAEATWNNANVAAVEGSVEGINASLIGSVGNVDSTGRSCSIDVKSVLENDEDKIVGFALFTETGREQEISNLKLDVTLVDPNTKFYKVTVKQVCGEETIATTETTVREGDPFTPDVENSFKKDGYLYTIEGGNETIESVSSDLDITVTYTKSSLDDVSGLPKTFVDENFDSYTTTGTSAQGTVAQQASLGDIILYVGARGSGGDGKTGVSLSDGALQIVSANYATSSRGVSIAIDPAKVTLPSFSELADGTVLEYSFKAKYTDANSTFQMMGITSNETTPGGAVVNDPYLSVANNKNIPTGEWVSVAVSVDKEKNAAIIITDADGKIVSSSSFKAIDDALSKIAFYGGATTVYMDDFKVVQKFADTGMFTATVKDSAEAAVAYATITVDRFKAATGADGSVSFALPNGEYTVVASKSGYEHTKGVADNDTKTVEVTSDGTSADFVLSTMSYDKIPETILVEGGQVFVAAPKTAEPNKTNAFTVKVLDQFGIEMSPEEYTLSWSILPVGSDEPDKNVTIDENGMVSVKQSFSADDNIRTYDVTAGVVANNAGLRSGKGSKTLTVGNNDVIYYEPIAWDTTSRDETKNLASSLTLPEISSVTIDVSMSPISRHHRTIALMTDAGALAGIQLQGEKTDSKGTIKAWTGAKQAGNKWNQYDFVNNYDQSFTLMTDYAAGTKLNVTFVIDTKNKAVNISCGDVSDVLPFTIDPKTFTGFRIGEADSTANFKMNEVLVVEPDNNYLSISGDTDFAKVGGAEVTRAYALGQSVIVPEETFNWQLFKDGQEIVAPGNASLAEATYKASFTPTKSGKAAPYYAEYDANGRLTSIEKGAEIDVTEGVPVTVDADAMGMVVMLWGGESGQEPMAATAVSAEDIHEVPTTEPTAAPTAEPTQAPTTEPTAAPTQAPTAAPTAEPTAEPTAAPTQEPTTGAAIYVDQNGVLHVFEGAEPGVYEIRATSNLNAEKTASLNVEIGDFQTFTDSDVTVVGAQAYDVTETGGTYAITSAVDSFGDDVISKLNNIVWTSSNEAVATITADGELEVKGAGNTEVKAAITNGTAVSTIIVPVTVAAYRITADATGNSTSVDTSALVSDPAIAGYQVTTSNDGKLVKQDIVSTAPSSVDTTGADKVEIAPVFELSGVSSSASKSIAIPADTYNFKLSGASGDRFDVYVNDQMLANNMLQGGSAVTNIDVNDIVVSEGYANINLRDYPKTPSLGKVQIVKAPSIVDRVKKVYVLGDSLVCIYANGGDATHNYQTGLGQVLQSYMTDDVEVVDLGNSGVIAEGLATSAITQVAKSGQKGDIMLLESGYNDRTYTTQDKMKAALISMYNDATAAEVTPIFMTPPASAHDYNPNVVWSGVMRSTAEELGVPVVDLAAVSYEFLNSTYGESFSDATVYSVYNVSDRLHSTFHGANKMASLVATEMAKLDYGDIVNDAYSYSFTDSNNNTITCKAEK